MQRTFRRPVFSRLGEVLKEMQQWVTRKTKGDVNI